MDRAQTLFAMLDHSDLQGASGFSIRFGTDPDAPVQNLTKSQVLALRFLDTYHESIIGAFTKKTRQEFDDSNDGIPSCFAVEDNSSETRNFLVSYFMNFECGIREFLQEFAEIESCIDWADQ